MLAELRRENRDQTSPSGLGKALHSSGQCGARSTPYRSVPGIVSEEKGSNWLCGMQLAYLPGRGIADAAPVHSKSLWEERGMLRLALVFLLIALIAASLGFP